MITLYLNTATKEWFDANGNSLRSDSPEVSFQTQEKFVIFAKSQTPYSNTEGVKPDTWPVDQTLVNTPGLGALATIDSDYIRNLKGELQEDITSGAKTIKVSFDSATIEEIPLHGKLRIFNKSGGYEIIPYESRNREDNYILFSISEDASLLNSYPKESRVDCNQAPLAYAHWNTAESSLEQGMFVFDMVIDSERLRSAFYYSDLAKLSIRGLEILFYTVNADGNQEALSAFLLNSLTLTGTMGTLGYEGEVPDPQRNEIAAIVGSLIGAGLDVEQRQGDNGAYEIRTKLASLSDDSWSDWVAVGQQLQIQYSADNISWQSTPPTDVQYMRTSTDGGATWSAALAFGRGEQGNPGKDGVDGEDGAAAGFGNITVQTNTLQPTESASVQVDASGEDKAKNFTFIFNIPKGAKGDKGDSFSPDVVGVTADKSTYDAQVAGFSFLDTTLGLIYFKQSDTSGDWSEGMPFGKGETGDAAGFGTPTVTINTLEAGASATASVSASGENTAKVFAFTFGIPKGDKGDKPINGVDYNTDAEKAALKTELLEELEDILLSGEWGTEA